MRLVSKVALNLWRANRLTLNLTHAVCYALVALSNFLWNPSISFRSPPPQNCVLCRVEGHLGLKFESAKGLCFVFVHIQHRVRCAAGSVYLLQPRS